MGKKKEKRVFVVGLTLMLMAAATGCSSDDDYRELLERGQEKYYNGEEMSREEYNAVKSFNDWKDKQGGKTYDEWD